MHTRPLPVHLLKVGSCRHLECLAVQGGRMKPVVFPALAALIIHPDAGPILFDTGYAEHFEHATQGFPERLYRWTTPVTLPVAQRLQQQLARHGLALADIRVCIVSHFHADHIAGLRDLPRARVIAMRRGYEDARRGGRWRGLLRGALPGLLPDDLSGRLHFADSYRALALPAPWQQLGQGHDLIGDGSLIGVSLPGHSAGHMGVLVRDAQDREVLLAADSSWSLQAVHDNLPPSRLVRPIFEDWKGYRRTLDTLHAVISRHPDLIILPSHCESALSRYESTWSRQ